MAQFARPDGDVTVSAGWVKQVGGSASLGDLYTAVDEVTPDASDFVGSDTTSGSFYECSLGDVIDPGVSTGHVVRYSNSKSSSAGKTIDNLIELRQGATVIASWNHLNISNVATQHNQTLTAAQADAITDYPDLRLRTTVTISGGGAGRSLYLYWAEFEVPDAGGTPPPLTPPGAFFPFFP